MTTHDNDKAHDAAERGNDLAEQWKRELIAEMTERRNKARSAADACKEGGWYRRQIETQVARYDDILAALTASEVKSAELELKQQSTLMKFDPATGWGNPYPSHAEQWREFNGATAWLFNPWTGDRRTAEDVGSDTFGHLILPPGEPLHATV